MDGLRTMGRHEVETVAGGNLFVDGTACVGGAIAIFGTEGLALLGLGVATYGACAGFVIELGISDPQGMIFGSEGNDTLIG